MTDRVTADHRHGAVVACNVSLLPICGQSAAHVPHATTAIPAWIVLEQPEKCNRLRPSAAVRANFVTIGIPDVQLVAYEVRGRLSLIMLGDEADSVLDEIELVRIAGKSQHEYVLNETTETASQILEEERKLIGVELPDSSSNSFPPNRRQLLERIYLAL